ncbi:TPA: hypothetical protein DCE37_04705 [Candidatus Latescibacteria bacterium]|nr:hypothetical protein [Candidatus Latescibacterota bacterium]
MACALAVKFFTSKHTESLEAEKIEVNNEHRRLKANYDKVFESRKQAEDKLRLFENDHRKLERHLRDAGAELEERIKRNEELAEDES